MSYFNCKSCDKEMNSFDIQNVDPNDWGWFCVRCKNTLRHRFLNWRINRLYKRASKLISKLSK